MELALEELARARDFSERSKTDLRDRAVKGPVHTLPLSVCMWCFHCVPSLSECVCVVFITYAPLSRWVC